MILFKELTKKSVKDGGSQFQNYHFHTLHTLFSTRLSQLFNNNGELMEGVKMWLSSMAAEFFDTGIQKLIP
jgi:hypothetical protein